MLLLSGSRAYKKPVNDYVRDIIKDAIKNETPFILGDAPGADTTWQKLLAELGATDVSIYHIGKAPRNNHVPNAKLVKCLGTYKDRDRFMCKLATRHICLIVGDSPGSKANIEDCGQGGCIQLVIRG